MHKTIKEKGLQLNKSLNTSSVYPIGLFQPDKQLIILITMQLIRRQSARKNHTHPE